MKLSAGHVLLSMVQTSKECSKLVYISVKITNYMPVYLFRGQMFHLYHFIDCVVRHRVTFNRTENVQIICYLMRMMYVLSESAG